MEVDWIYLAQDKVKWRAFVKTVMILYLHITERMS
jgi:hypothetical protein